MDIKKKIQQYGMTSAEVAEKMGVSAPTLSAICSSKNPKFNSLEKIANAIGITVSELVSDSYNDNSPAEIECPYCHKKIIIKTEIVNEGKTDL